MNLHDTAFGGRSSHDTAVGDRNLHDTGVIDRNLHDAAASDRDSHDTAVDDLNLHDTAFGSSTSHDTAVRDRDLRDAAIDGQEDILYDFHQFEPISRQEEEQQLLNVEATATVTTTRRTTTTAGFTTAATKRPTTAASAAYSTASSNAGTFEAATATANSNRLTAGSQPPKASPPASFLSPAAFTNRPSSQSVTTTFESVFVSMHQIGSNLLNPAAAANYGEDEEGRSEDTFPGILEQSFDRPDIIIEDDWSRRRPTALDGSIRTTPKPNVVAFSSRPPRLRFTEGFAVEEDEAAAINIEVTPHGTFRPPRPQPIFHVTPAQLQGTTTSQKTVFSPDDDVTLPPPPSASPKIGFLSDDVTLPPMPTSPQTGFLSTPGPTQPPRYVESTELKMTEWKTL